MGAGKTTRKILDKIFGPCFSLIEEHGKTISVVSTICLTITITNLQTQQILLPKDAKDTVGEIPVINYFDDGRLDSEAIYTESRRSFENYPIISSDYIVTTSDFIFYR